MICENSCAPKYFLHLLTNYLKFHHCNGFLWIKCSTDSKFFSFFTLYLEIFKHIQKYRKWYKEWPYTYHQASSTINSGPASPTQFISFPNKIIFKQIIYYFIPNYFSKSKYYWKRNTIICFTAWIFFSWNLGLQGRNAEVREETKEFQPYTFQWFCYGCIKNSFLKTMPM